jgi:hypothetical protein
VRGVRCGQDISHLRVPIVAVRGVRRGEQQEVLGESQLTLEDLTKEQQAKLSEIFKDWKTAFPASDLLQRPRRYVDDPVPWLTRPEVEQMIKAERANLIAAVERVARAPTTDGQSQVVHEWFVRLANELRRK